MVNYNLPWWALARLALEEEKRRYEARYRPLDRYYKTARWIRKREAVKQRDHLRCVRCPDKPATEVHHVSYPRGCQPGSEEWDRQETLDTLISVCTPCHRALHATEHGPAGGRLR